MDVMINATGFPAKEYDNEVTGKGVIPAEVTIAVKDKEVAQGLLELIKGDIAVLKTNVPTDIMYKKEDVHTVAIGRRLEKGKEVVFYRLMRGSHTYDSREMSELIKGTIQEAEDLGIETLTPRELEQMLGKWKPRKEEEK